MKLQSIAKEAAACRAAWAAVPKAQYGVHIHHEIAVEKLTSPIENRVAYILSGKPKKEQALRLRLMRPITKAQFDEYNRVKAVPWAEYNRVTAVAHLPLCVPDCPFDGRSLFTGRPVDPRRMGRGPKPDGRAPMTDDTIYVWLIESYAAHWYDTKDEAEAQIKHRGYSAKATEHGFIQEPAHPNQAGLPWTKEATGSHQTHTISGHSGSEDRVR